MVMVMVCDSDGKMAVVREVTAGVVMAMTMGMGMERWSVIGIPGY